MLLSTSINCHQNNLNKHFSIIVKTKEKSCHLPSLHLRVVSILFCIVALQFDQTRGGIHQGYSCVCCHWQRPNAGSAEKYSGKQGMWKHVSHVCMCVRVHVCTCDSTEVIANAWKSMCACITINKTATNLYPVLLNLVHTSFMFNMLV